jgi:hypothetical protein
MKFQGAIEFMHVPPDLTTATLYKYMVLHLLFPLHSWHCYVQTESITARWQLCARGISGKRLLCQISSGHWTRLPKWKWPECQDAGLLKVTCGAPQMGQCHCVTCNTCCLPRTMSNGLIGAIKLCARILAIENISAHDQGNVVAFNKIACNEQEKLPPVLRALVTSPVGLHSFHRT